MNLLLLAIAFRAWSGSALSAYLRIMAAIATLSIEMQFVTWTHVGSLRSLRLVNVGLAVLGVLWHARRRSRTAAEAGDAAPVAPAHPISQSAIPPLPAVVVLALIIATIALLRPVMGADPYHLHRVDQITGRGTLAYDPAALDIKINALAGVYELLLADLRIPGMATALVRLHGLLGLGLYLVVVGAVSAWVPVRRRWLLITFLVIPVVFHQLVLIKNDLFGAMPVFVALAWVVIRGRDLTLPEIAAAAALAGFAVGIKISSVPVVLIVLGFVWWDHRGQWKPLLAALGSALGGAVAGGLAFTLIENHIVYGGAWQPYIALGNRHEHLGDALAGLWRFALSLIDLGSISPRLWPGRGGWGSTLGLPLIWSGVVLAWKWRDPIVGRAIIAVGTAFIAFAVSYPDADIAHRMVIGPGLLAVLVALGRVDNDERFAILMRRALIVVLVASALQIGRSAILYLRG